MRAASRRIASTARGDGPDRILVGGQPQNRLAQLGRERVERRRHDVRLDLGEDRTPAGGMADGVYHRPPGPRAARLCPRVSAEDNRAVPRPAYALVADRPGQDRMRPVTAAHIEVHAVSKQWLTRDHPVPALETVSLDIAPQEFLTVLGPSGCGKSTLLSIIGGSGHARHAARCASRAAR